MSNNSQLDENTVRPHYHQHHNDHQYHHYNNQHHNQHQYYHQDHNNQHQYQRYSRRNSCPDPNDLEEQHAKLWRFRRQRTDVLLAGLFFAGLIMVHLISQELGSIDSASYAHQHNTMRTGLRQLDSNSIGEEARKYKQQYNNMQRQLVYPVPKSDHAMRNGNQLHNNRDPNPNQGGNDYITETGTIIQSQPIPETIPVPEIPPLPPPAEEIPPPPPPVEEIPPPPPPAEEIVAVLEIVDAPPVVIEGPEIMEPLRNMMGAPIVQNMEPLQQKIDDPEAGEAPPAEVKEPAYDFFQGLNGMFDQAPIEAIVSNEEENSPEITTRDIPTRAKPEPYNFVAIGLVGLPKVEPDGEVRLSELGNFKHVSEPWDKSDVPIFLHIPKAGGSTVKDIMGTCHRFVMASEKGVLDGHGSDADISIVYPGGGPAGQDRSPFVNVDTTTLNGIVRAKDMNFADSGLADIVVTPFIFQVNDLMTPTAKGRLFTVFRHPIERAISMFYYIQIANWEETYDPEVEFWTVEQYAKSSKVENNWLTRQLSNQLTGELTDTNLIIAKSVIRSKFMVGLVSNIEATMDRFEKFFRWTYHVNPPNQEICRQALMDRGANSNSQNAKPKPVPGSEDWKMLEWQNIYDLKLYSYIEALFDEQEQFVSNLPDGFRNIDATCCKCGPATYPPEGFDCPVSISN